MAPGAVLFFDGVCNLCNRSVQFVLDHERGPSLSFASLQSDRARELLGRVLTPDEVSGLLGSGREPGSLVLLEDGHVHTRSTGALRLARYLRAPWRWLGAFVVVPRPLRDAIYGLVARNRYRWFGRTSECRVPTPALRARLLD